MTTLLDSPALLCDILALPKMWHASGSLHHDVLRALMEIPPCGLSVETGTGKSTLIFSHRSRRHLVFTLDDYTEEGSLRLVKSSPLLGDSAEFIVGPSQLTLPKYDFTPTINLAFIDGPHGYPFPELEYYYLYPYIVPGGYLILDDIQIPTVTRLFEFVREDEMFRLEKVIKTTAFFRRTDAPLFDPLGDGWWLQKFNTRRFPNFRYAKLSPLERMKQCVPLSWRGKLKAIAARLYVTD